MKDNIQELLNEIHKINSLRSISITPSVASRVLARYRYLEFMYHFLIQEHKAIGLPPGALCYIPTVDVFFKNRVKTPVGIDLVIGDQKVNALKYAVVNKDVYKDSVRGVLKLYQLLTSTGFSQIRSPFEQELITRIPCLTPARTIRGLSYKTTRIYIVDDQVLLMITYNQKGTDAVVTAINLGGLIRSIIQESITLTMKKEDWFPYHIRKTPSTAIGMIRAPHFHLTEKHCSPDHHSYFTEDRIVPRSKYTFEYIAKKEETGIDYFIPKPYWDNLVKRHQIDALIHHFHQTKMSKSTC